jgi:hypothetical protein
MKMDANSVQVSKIPCCLGRGTVRRKHFSELTFNVMKIYRGFVVIGEIYAAGVEFGIRVFFEDVLFLQ